MQYSSNLQAIIKNRIINIIQTSMAQKLLGQIFNDLKELSQEDIKALGFKNYKENITALSTLNPSIGTIRGNVLIRVFGGKILNQKLFSREIELTNKYFKQDQSKILIAVFEDCVLCGLDQEADSRVIVMKGLKSSCWKPHYTQLKNALSSRR